MAWVVLLVSSVFEAVWATALGLSHGLTRPVPVVVFVAGMVLSMSGLGWTMNRLPVSVAYSVWTGCGAALTVVYAMLAGDEPVSVLKALFLAGIVACVVGLRLVGGGGDGKKPEADGNP